MLCFKQLQCQLAQMLKFHSLETLDFIIDEYTLIFDLLNMKTSANQG